MFSFLWKKPSSSSSLPSHRTRTSDDAEPWSADDMGYDDVAFGSHASPTSDDSPTLARGASISGSRADFVNSRPVSNDPQASYPPLPSFSKPSSSSSSKSNQYPSLKRTFKRLEQILEEKSPSLLDSLADPIIPATDPALASLIHLIAPYRLPPAFIDAYAIHDGQDPFSSNKMNNGLIWGLRWLPLEGIEIEWKAWRSFEALGGLNKIDGFGHYKQDLPKNGRSHPYIEEEERIDEMPVKGMSSFPSNWIRCRYSHPGWLPILTDRCGNYIGIDLDPPPPPPPSSSSSSTQASSSKLSSGRSYGQPGQVIAFGREIDEKVVLFPGDGQHGWARFLASFVEDLEGGQFARLGEAQDAGRASPKINGWGSDVEKGRDGDDSPDGDEDERRWEGDGLGDRGYLDGDVWGEEVENEGNGPSGRTDQTWILRSEYRRMAETIPGGIIGLIAERSKRKWRSLGVGTRSNTSSTVPNSSSNAVASSSSSSTSKKPALAILVPEVPESGPESSTTVRASSPTLLQNGHDGHSSPSSSVEVVLSPPSPRSRKNVSFDEGSNSSKGKEVERDEGLPDEPPRTQKSSRAQSKSPELLHDGRRSSSSSSSRISSGTKRRNRAPPPPPMSLDLPTLGDLLEPDSAMPIINSVSINMSQEDLDQSISNSSSSTTTTRKEHQYESVRPRASPQNSSFDETRSFDEGPRGSGEEATLSGRAADSQVDLHEGDVTG